MKRVWSIGISFAIFKMLKLKDHVLESIGFGTANLDKMIAEI